MPSDIPREGFDGSFCRPRLQTASRALEFPPRAFGGQAAGALPGEMDRAVRELMRSRGGFGSVQPLSLPSLVDDHAERSIVFDEAAVPRLVAMLSPRRYPRLAFDAAAKTQAVRQRLGAQSGKPVLLPLHVGESDGCSFAITPFRRPWRAAGLAGLRDRHRLRAPVLSWLRALTQQSAAIPTPDAVTDAFVLPLQRLAENPGVDAGVRIAASQALQRLHAGWLPRFVIAHNDFWIGNLLQGAREDPRNERFAVIDWGASQLQGRPMYDLVRIAMSLRMPKRALRDEVAAHCALLECEPRDARHHLSAALAQLADHLGQWPVERFSRTALDCLQFLERAA